MKYLDLTLPTAAENLACDEALLDGCEERGAEVFRVWEAREHFVVLGYANKASLEVNMTACGKRGVSVLRRCSGGGAVLQGPGCLNYSLVMRIGGAGVPENIGETNCFIMSRHAEVVSSLLNRPVAVQGFTDLAVNNLKFSGNSQRRKRESILFHGTFLLDFDLTLVDELLLFPSKQPDYRRNRSHTEFLTRVPLQAEALNAALRKAWGAVEPLLVIPRSCIDRLVEEKYSKQEWNLKW